MKNIVKRIAAMGAAVMMMSSMAIGASAANSYNLHYTKGDPSSDIVCQKWMYGINAQNNGYLKSTCKSINTSGKFGVLANGYRSSSHTINCGSFNIWNKGTTNWKNSNYKKGYSYDVVAPIHFIPSRERIGFKILPMLKESSLLNDAVTI